jgi:hypothetical protein
VQRERGEIERITRLPERSARRVSAGLIAIVDEMLTPPGLSGRLESRHLYAVEINPARSLWVCHRRNHMSRALRVRASGHSTDHAVA